MQRLFLSIFFILIIVSCSPAPNLSTATTAPSTQTSTPIPLPTFTSMPSPSPTPAFPIRDGGVLYPSASVITKDNLSQLKELAVWGKGAVKAIRWSDDGGQIIVDASMGRYVYDSVSFQLLEEKNLQLAEIKPELSFSIEDLGLTLDPITNGVKGHFRVQVSGNQIGSFDVDTVYRPWITYRPDSNIIVVDKMMGGVELRDGTTYEVFCNIDGTWESPLAATKDRAIVAVGTMDGFIRLKSGEEFSNTLTLEAGGPVRFLSFSPEGTKLVSESNGSISVWDVSSNKAIGTLSDTFVSGDFFYDQYHYGTDAGLGVTVKENNIAYVNKNTVNILNLVDGKKSRLINSKEGILLDKEYKYEGNYQEIDSVFFSPDTKTMMTVVFDRTYVWDRSTGQFINMIAQIKEKRQFDLVSVYSAPDHLLLIGSQGNNYIRIFNVDDGSVLPSIKAWDTGSLLYGYDGTHSLTISPDGKFVFSWSGLEGVASLWEIKTRQRAMAIKIHASEYSKYQPGFYPVAISPDNTKLVFTYSLDPDAHIAIVYSIPDGKELYRILARYAVFPPDGSIIAASVGNNMIRFYDAATGKVLGNVTSTYPNPDGFQLLYFSEDGKTLTAVSSNGTIGIWGIP